MSLIEVFVLMAVPPLLIHYAFHGLRLHYKFGELTHLGGECEHEETLKRAYKFDEDGEAVFGETCENCLQTWSEDGELIIGRELYEIDIPLLGTREQWLVVYKDGEPTEPHWELGR